MNIERTSASTVPSENENEGLKRVVGIPTLAATVVNSSVGAGIYTLPAIIAMYLGAAGIIGFLFCGLMFAAIVLCYVEMGSRVKVSGGFRCKLVSILRVECIKRRSHHECHS